nr:lipopolysaccharide-induced tumor necrosis factor-alpha factor homolog [Pocillopora verrucosa]
MAAPQGQNYGMNQGQYPPNYYPPQQPGYYQPPPQAQYAPHAYYQPGYGAPGTQALTVIQQPVGLPQPIVLKQFPVTMGCPHCGATISTQLVHRVGNTTFLYCFILSCFGCCCIPFCTDCAKDVAHLCPNCHKEIGVYRRPVAESGGGGGGGNTGYDRSNAHGPADDYVGPSDD